MGLQAVLSTGLGSAFATCVAFQTLLPSAGIKIDILLQLRCPHFDLGPACLRP